MGVFSPRKQRSPEKGPLKWIHSGSTVIVERQGTCLAHIWSGFAPQDHGSPCPALPCALLCREWSLSTLRCGGEDKEAQRKCSSSFSSTLNSCFLHWLSLYTEEIVQSQGMYRGTWDNIDCIALLPETSSTIFLLRVFGLKFTMQISMKEAPEATKQTNKDPHNRTTKAITK